MTHREHISNRLFLIKSILDLNRIELKESVYHLHRHNEAVAKQPSQMRQNVSKTGRPSTVEGIKGCQMAGHSIGEA
jgi:hypothetical protein